MNKKSIAIVILVLIVILYAVATILGIMGLGTISVYTDKKEYKPGEKITIYTKNTGLTLLVGVPKWEIYKVDDNNETLVFLNGIRGPQYVWPQGYFGIDKISSIWDPSTNYYSVLNNVGPQKEGTYKIVAKILDGFTTSDSTTVIIK